MSHLRNRHIKTSVRLPNEGKFNGKVRHASPQVTRLHASERTKTEPDLYVQSLYNQYFHSH